MIRIIIAAISLAASCSCHDGWEDNLNPAGTVGRNPGDRTNTEYNRNVFLIYSIGFNNLSSYLKEDIDDIAAGKIPSGFDHDDVILVFSHSAKGSYRNPNPPVLFRIYRDWNGNPVRDTLLVMDEKTVSASPRTLNEVLTYVKDNFHARRYGMLMSSHATGWVPAGYTSKGKDMEDGNGL